MRRARLSASAAASLALASQAYAANPLHKDVCILDPVTQRQVLDREKLALFVLKDKGIGWQFGQWAQAQATAEEAALAAALPPGTTAPPSARPSLAVRILLCNAITDCNFDGSDKLIAAQFQISDILGDKSGSFSNPRHAKIGEFYSDPSIVVECVERSPGRPVEIAGSAPPPPEFNLPLKLRGNTDSLMFLRGQPDFKAAEKVNVSFTDDGIASKKSVKLVGVLGWAFPLIEGAPVAPADDPRPHPPAYANLELIPYAGINHDLSRVTGQARKVTSKDWRLGAVLIGRQSSSFGSGDKAGWSLMHVMEMRPELLFDDVNHAQIASVNLRYMPVASEIFGLPVGLNAYRRIVPSREYFFSYRPIFDIRFNNGTFTKQGDRPDLQAQDFSRIGTQFGFAISHDNFRFPIDLTVTETYMHALSGYPRDLSQFRSVLSLSFDTNNYFGLDLSYVKGKREDLLAREEKWSVAFTARY
ncbi:hypothetical protein [Sphingomonas sp. NIBR02145]|uniref:hypothetical protein n=1 Tax=Sphingomonas sp. NIBR02145 TaxID=3014784 RepID=UPI0022B38CC8|nr:hypothetical protein [Sphingomonas sp. NIBR02145]WHU03103.1 hypothetical protein O3305_00360 [Sphingomonas sp. NIBR02145]